MSEWDDLSDDEVFARLSRCPFPVSGMALALVQRREEPHIAEIIDRALDTGP